jgi:hypothetical protein
MTSSGLRPSKSMAARESLARSLRSRYFDGDRRRTSGPSQPSITGWSPR